MYIDVMVGGRFYCQIPYTYCPLWPIDSKEVSDFIIQKRPSLAGKELSLEFSNNRVY